MASVGLPGTSGFVGEFLVMTGAFQANTWAAALAALGVILGAAYMLYLYRRVIFGVITRDDLKKMLDLSRREIAVFVPLIVVVLWMGIYPRPVLDVFGASVDQLVARYKQAQLVEPETGARRVASLTD
jgi:NADH-quinone oxidoreductase subunit M